MLQSRTDVHRAPLWLMKATFPSFAIFLANVAFRPIEGIITPRQFGPMIRISPRRSWISCSSFTPPAPVSLNPAETTTAPLTPAAAHSLVRLGTVEAGAAITPRPNRPGAFPGAGEDFSLI